jgi:hypothetical protein
MRNQMDKSYKDIELLKNQLKNLNKFNEVKDMDNKEESLRLLKEAEEDFERARRYAEFKDWVTIIHYARPAIEKSAKAIISCFEAYEWTHDPSEQLIRLFKKVF